MRAFQHIPPVAFPLEVKDFLAGFDGALHPERASEKFITALRGQFDERRVFLLNSGRAALTLALLAAKQHGQSDKVVLPAYSCSTVLQSVLAAGLTPIFVDLSSQTLDYEKMALSEQLKQKPMAVVGGHLFGLAHDYSDLAQWCREAGVVFIEDCAQAFGAGVRDKPLGLQGSMSIFSLGSGKNLPVGGGGVLIADDVFSPELSTLVEERAGTNSNAGYRHLIKLLAYRIAVNPFGWWWVDRSPFNPAGAGGDFSRLPDIYIELLSGAGAGIGLSILDRSAGIYNQWRTNAAALLARMRDFPFIQLPLIGDECRPVYLRFPIVVESQHRADLLFARLRNTGIGVSRSYRFTLPGLVGETSGIAQRAFPGAEKLAGCLLTLPTNHFLDQRAIDVIASIFEEERECQ